MIETFFNILKIFKIALRVAQYGGAFGNIRYLQLPKSCPQHDIALRGIRLHIVVT